MADKYTQIKVSETVEDMPTTSVAKRLKDMGDGTFAEVIEVGLSSASSVTKTDKSSAIALGGTSQELMAANPSRLGWQLQNNSAGTLAFNELGNAASLTSGSFLLYPGDAYEAPAGGVSTAQINIIGATTGQVFTAREW